MKKKIIATLFIAIIATSAFLMGHATTATEKTMIAVEDVTGWNTDGKEISLCFPMIQRYTLINPVTYTGKNGAYIPLQRY